MTRVSLSPAPMLLAALVVGLGAVAVAMSAPWVLASTVERMPATLMVALFGMVAVDVLAGHFIHQRGGLPKRPEPYKTLRGWITGAAIVGGAHVIWLMLFDAKVLIIGPYMWLAGLSLGSLMLAWEVLTAGADRAEMA